MSTQGRILTLMRAMGRLKCQGASLEVVKSTYKQVSIASFTDVFVWS